jgi:hypothetical protein
MSSFLSKVELKYQLQRMGINIVKGNYVRKSNVEKVIALKEEPLSQDLHGSFNLEPKLCDVISALVVGGGLNKNLYEKCKNALDNIWKLINPDKPIPRSEYPDLGEDWTYEDSPEIRKGEKLNWKSIVHPSKSFLKDPLSVLMENRDGYENIVKKHPRGYFRTIPFDPDVIAKTLSKDDDYLFSTWKKGDLRPIITIDNYLGDGTHRCMFAYWLDVDVPVVKLNI